MHINTIIYRTNTFIHKQQPNISNPLLQLAKINIGLTLQKLKFDYLLHILLHSPDLLVGPLGGPSETGISYSGSWYAERSSYSWPKFVNSYASHCVVVMSSSPDLATWLQLAGSFLQQNIYDTPTHTLSTILNIVEITINGVKKWCCIWKYSTSFLNVAIIVWSCELVVHTDTALQSK